MRKLWQYIYLHPNPGETRSRFSILLVLWFIVSIIAPNFALAVTEEYSIWTIEALILMPLGFYFMWSVALRRAGFMIWIGFPFIFFETTKPIVPGPQCAQTLIGIIPLFRSLPSSFESA